MPLPILGQRTANALLMQFDMMFFVGYFRGVFFMNFYRWIWTRLTYEWECLGLVLDWHSFGTWLAVIDLGWTQSVTICKFVFLGGGLKVGLKFILREDQGPSRIERLFLGYGDKWPRKWLGIGRAFANPRPMHCQCSANALVMQFDMLLFYEIFALTR